MCGVSGIDTFEGNDLINPVIGSGDSVDGGLGSDLLIVDYSVGQTGGRASGGGINSSSSGSISRFDPVGNTTDSVNYSNIERLQITGTNYNDSFTDGSNNDTIRGGAGNDVITSVGGLDNLDGGTGLDTLNVNLSSRSVSINLNNTSTQLLTLADGTRIANFELFKSIQTGNGNDIVRQRTTDPSDPSIELRNDSASISTSGGNDVINPGIGSGQTVDGGLGSDLLIVDYSVGQTGGRASGGGISLSGSGQINRVNSSGRLSDSVNYSNIERLQITGTQFNDNFVGGTSDDTLDGGAGNDTLDGGAGNDSLIGGGGTDSFLYNISAPFVASAVGVDTINDFSIGFDKIVLDKTTFDVLTSVPGNGFSVTGEFATVSSDAVAATSSANIVYSIASGNLFYNQNASVAGFGTGDQFATLTGTPAIAATDFIIQV